MTDIPQVTTEAEARTVWEACREILHVDYSYWNLMAFLFEGDLADRLNSTFINEWEAFSRGQQAQIRAICKQAPAEREAVKKNEEAADEQD